LPAVLKIPAGLKQNIINVVNDWLKAPLSELNTLLIYVAVVSLTTSVIFYFLKKRNEKKQAVSASS